MPIDPTPLGAIGGKHDHASHDPRSPAKPLTRDVRRQPELLVVLAQRGLDRDQLRLHLNHEQRLRTHMPSEEIDGAALAEDRVRHLRADLPAPPGEVAGNRPDQRGVSLVEQPVQEAALPPHIEPGRCPERSEDRTHGSKRRAVEPTPLDERHEPLAHARPLGEVQLAQALLLSKESDGPTDRRVVHGGEDDGEHFARDARVRVEMHRVGDETHADWRGSAMRQGGQSRTRDDRGIPFASRTRCYPRPMLNSGVGGQASAVAPRILIVDDDPNLLVLLADQLRADGFDISTARDGDEALRRLETAWPDLLLIDMMMPRMDGLSLAREIKAKADLPIIVISAIDAGDSKADLLEEVAEDYVTKPYHYPELRARINRVLRRLGDKVPRQRLILGPDLSLELHRREATLNGTTVQLTPTESRLLYALAANLGRTVTTETLLARGWADTEDADPSYVWVTMRRLRQKVEVDPNKPVHLQTVRGIGYRLVGTTPEAASGTFEEATPDADR